MSSEDLNESMIDEDGEIGGGTAIIAAATMNVSADDVLQTMQAKLVLRKNLDQDFNTVSEKIAHFESESKKNFLAAAAAAAAATMITSSKAPSMCDESISVASNNCPRFQVFLRIRPSTDRTNTIHILNSTTVQTNPPSSLYSALSKEYTYDAVLDPNLSQVQVYERTAAPLVERLVQHNETVLLFCHGVTNAGKTFTIHGEGSSSSSAALEPSWGILPRVVHDMFHRLTLMPSKELQMTCFELYQERFYDLLPDDSGVSANSNSMHQRTALRLREDKINGLAYVEGLAKRKVESVSQALQWMKVAKKNRTTATNHLNQTSSRSHCVCQLIVTNTEHLDDLPVTFWVVDLAGSERCKRTAGSGAMRHQEACFINKSLMTLMRCLMTLKETTTTTTGTIASAANSNNNMKMPPFRESKLTQLLMPHWSESSRTVTAMIVNVNPSASDYEESQHVLSYATQAKTIQLTNNNNHRSSQTHAGAGTVQQVEYDENGRRKRPAGGMRAKVGQLLQKLSPKRGVMVGIKRKADVNKASNHTNAVLPNKRAKAEPSSAVRPTTGGATAGVPFASQRNTVKSVPPGTSIKSSKAYKALQMELAVATAENAFLKSDKRELEEQLENIEDQVRAEMAEEMDKQMEAMRSKYEAILQTYRQQKVTASAMKATPSRRRDDQLLEEKIQQLEDQVQECEEEMIRQREEHARELDEIRLEGERKLLDALKDNEYLRNELEQKQEMLDNYSKLLQEEEDDDEEDVDDAEEIDEEQVEAEYDVASVEEQSTRERDGDVGELDSDSEEVHNGISTEDDQEDAAESANEASDCPSSVYDLSVHSEATAVASVDYVHTIIDLTQDADSNVRVESKVREHEGEERICDAPLSTAVNVTDEGNERKTSSSVDSNSFDAPFEEFSDENVAPVQTKPCDQGHIQKENDFGLSASTRPISDRKPLGVSGNKREHLSTSDSEDEQDMWLPPKKPAKFDSKTGMYQRPKGRPPSGVESWDSKKGKWRLSTA